jgi:hypothetical protein
LADSKLDVDRVNGFFEELVKGLTIANAVDADILNVITQIG